MKKRILSILLSILMVISFLPVMALAAGNEPVTLLVDSTATDDSAARGDQAKYQTFTGALTAAQAGDTIKLETDITIASNDSHVKSDENWYTIGKAVIIDLNSKTLTVNSSYMGLVVDAAFTLKNGTVTSNNQCTIYSNHSSFVTLDSVSVENTNTSSDSYKFSLYAPGNTLIRGTTKLNSMAYLATTNVKVEAGTYNFDPSSYVDATKFYVDSTNSAQNEWKVYTKIATPTAVTGLAENDEAQTGVLEGEGYTLSGQVTGKAAGNYTATATLAEGYVWADGTTANKTINWSIAHADTVAKIGTTEYKTFAGALKAAQAGSTEAEKTVTVVGEVNGYKFDGNYDGITIQSSNSGKITGNFTAAENASLKGVQIDGLKFEKSQISFIANSLNLENMVIQNCEFDGTGATGRLDAIKILADQANGLTITNNKIKNYTTTNSTAMILQVVGSTGIAEGHTVTISNNEISNIDYNAIQAVNLPKLVISGNTISGCKKNKGPINLQNTAVAEITGNTITLAEGCAGVVYNINEGIVTMTGNTIKDSAGAALTFNETLANVNNTYEGVTGSGIIVLKGATAAADRYFAVSKDVLTAAFPQTKVDLVPGTTYTYTVIPGTIVVAKAKDGSSVEVADPVFGAALTDYQLFTVAEKFEKPAEYASQVEWKHVDGQGNVTWNTTSIEATLSLTNDGKVTTTAETPAGDYVFRITNGQPEKIDDPASTSNPKAQIDNPAFISSGEITLTVGKLAETAPAANTGYTLNYADETLVAGTGYEVSSTNEDTATALTNDKVEPGTTYYVRKAASDTNHAPSAWTAITILARPATPNAPVLSSKTDTTVTVTAVTGQEYSVDGGTSWQDSGEFTGLTAGTAYSIITRVKATESAFASANSTALSCTTKTAAAVAPTVTGVVVTENSVTLPTEGTPNTYEYSADGTDWSDTREFTGLTAATQYTYYVRVKETETAMPSQTKTVSVYTAAATPQNAAEAGTVSYTDETFTPNSGYEISKTDGESFSAMALTSGKAALEPGKTYYVRKAAVEGGAPASETVSFTVPARPGVVSGVETKQESIAKRDDSYLHGVTEDMQYCISTDGGVTFSNWYSGYGGSIAFPLSTLSSGAYYTVKVRTKATESAFAGEETTFTFTRSTKLVTVKMGEDSVQVDADTPVEKKTPTQEGYTFGGWFIDEALQYPWNFGDKLNDATLNMLKDQCENLTDNFVVTFYPKWIKNTVPSKAISGKVTEGSANVSGALVELYLGNKQIAVATTDSDGNYSFDNVENGTYNIVVTKADGKTKTELVTINNSSATVNVALPTSNVNSVVEHAGSEMEDAKSDIGKTVVGGLDAIAAAQTVTGGNKVTIKLTVEPKDPDTVENADEIKALAGNGKKVEFLDMSLWKITTMDQGSEAKGNIGGNNSTLLTIVIPFDFTGVDVSSVMILRHHGSSEKLTKNPAAGEEGYTVDAQAGTITIYAKQFSTYAIGYEARSSSGSGNYTPGHTVTSDLNNVTKVTVDGKVVDSKYYTVSGGSVYLSGEFMKTLTNGKHIVKLYDGLKVATGTMTVTGNAAVQSAATGDAGLALYGILSISSLLGMGWVSRKKH